MASSLGVNGGTRLSSACKRHIFRLVNRFHLLIRRMILVIVIATDDGKLQEDRKSTLQRPCYVAVFI